MKHLNQAKVVTMAATLVHHVETKELKQDTRNMTSIPHTETGFWRKICKGSYTSNNLKKIEALITAKEGTRGPHNCQRRYQLQGELCYKIYMGLYRQLHNFCGPQLLWAVRKLLLVVLLAQQLLALVLDLQYLYRLAFEDLLTFSDQIAELWPLEVWSTPSTKKLL